MNETQPVLIINYEKLAVLLPFPVNYLCFILFMSSNPQKYPSKCSGTEVLFSGGHLLKRDPLDRLHFICSIFGGPYNWPKAQHYLSKDL